MKIKKINLYGLGILVLLIIGIYFLYGSKSVSANEIATVGNFDNAKKVVIGMQDYNYYPEVIELEVNEPVSISLDDSVYGCFRDFTIRDFGIHKHLKSPEDTVEFIPHVKGTYTFACSMGMGTGKLVVK